MDPSTKMTGILSQTSTLSLGSPDNSDALMRQQQEAHEGSGELVVTDKRTGKQYVIQIKNNVINATDLMQIQDVSGRPLKSYDPGLFNTAVCSSRITYINGEEGTLAYRGYDIEELAQRSTFLEVAFLLIKGDLPSKRQLEDWCQKIMHHTFIHENLAQLMKTFRYDAHPMGMLISSLGALGTFYPDANPALQGANLYSDKKLRNTQVYRIIGKMPTIAACAYRHRVGRPYNHPVNHLSYAGNFLYMLDRLSEPNYVPDPRLTKALDVLFILHADHELNCSTAAMRHIASSCTDPVTAVAAAASALYGPLHGGANEAALDMLLRIGSVENIPAFLQGVKDKKQRLMGFGHRVYKNYDPRAKILKTIAYEVFDICGRDPLIDIAIELERAALADPYFQERRLYPNVDFYSGLIYKAMGFPVDMFPVLFSIPRTVGWLAHWLESLDDEENRIMRPKQVYLGKPTRSYVPVHQRPPSSDEYLEYHTTGTSKRSTLQTPQRFLSSGL